MDKLIGYF